MFKIIARIGVGLSKAGVGLLSILGLGSVVSASESSTGILGVIINAFKNIWNSIFGGFGSIVTILFFVLIGILLIKIFKK